MGEGQIRGAAVLTHEGLGLTPGVCVGITAWTTAKRRPISFTGFVLLSYFGCPCVLAISRWSIPQCAQAREGEAEKLQLSFRYLDCS